MRFWSCDWEGRAKGEETSSPGSLWTPRRRASEASSAKGGRWTRHSVGNGGRVPRVLDSGPAPRPWRLSALVTRGCAPDCEPGAVPHTYAPCLYRPVDVRGPPTRVRLDAFDGPRPSEQAHPPGAAQGGRGAAPGAERRGGRGGPRARLRARCGARPLRGRTSKAGG